QDRESAITQRVTELRSLFANAFSGINLTPEAASSHDAADVPVVNAVAQDHPDESDADDDRHDDGHDGDDHAVDDHHDGDDAGAVADGADDTEHVAGPGRSDDAGAAGDASAATPVDASADEDTADGLATSDGGDVPVSPAPAAPASDTGDDAMPVSFAPQQHRYDDGRQA
ncbi:MAG: hypothetical protein L0K48_03800, partial [Bifidobacterium mongoliense]|nr:hypothetical protein [Bifidobacterium mongoliense]